MKDFNLDMMNVWILDEVGDEFRLAFDDLGFGSEDFFRILSAIAVIIRKLLTVVLRNFY